MRRRTRSASLTVLGLCILVAACAPGLVGTKIELKRFSPAIKADLGEYRGKRIYLMNFDSEARDTSMWYYYSPDRKFTYGADSTLHNYFWYSFEKALHNLGMIVSNVDRPDPNAPAMWLTLKSVSDAAYTVEVKVQKFGPPIFTKMYTVTDEFVGPDKRTVDVLEARAYAMTNRLIEAVLTDPAFKGAYLQAAAELAPSQGR
jgi:hypothetical protein